MDSSTLEILRMVPSASNNEAGQIRELRDCLAALIHIWRDLKWSFLWYLVEYERRWLDDSKEGELSSVNFISSWPNFIRFDIDDFDRALNLLEAKSSIHDRLICLSIAFDIYVQDGRAVSLRRRLKRAAASHPKLGERLSWLMKPPQSAELRRIKRSNAVWVRRAKERQAAEAQTEEMNRQFIRDNLEKEVISPTIDPSIGMTRAQLHLLDKARQAHDKSESKFSQNNWRDLVPEFGDQVALGYREAALNFWRRTNPKLISEGAPLNTTPYTAVFGLIGIAIEASELPHWAERLTVQDAEVAFRLAMHEMNGFPVWLPQLHNQFPDLICDLYLKEIKFEIDQSKHSIDTNYVLSDVSWSGQWLWNSIAPGLKDLIRCNDPCNLKCLQRVLAILQGSSLHDNDLCELAAYKARNVKHWGSAATWFAAWTGIDPNAAIPALRLHLAQISKRKKAVRFVMVFVTQLVGSRLSRSAARDAYNNAASLKELYLLVESYLPENDGRKRSPNGVSSVDIDSEAEEARSILFAKLRDMPGKAAFVSLMELAEEHPDPSYRSWALQCAHKRAEVDSNGPPWSSLQVREFNDRLGRTPSNHRELFDLAVMRLEDLKYDLEDGDASEADVLLRVQDETEMRNVLGSRLRLTSQQRYRVVQEEEYADGKRVDLRFHATTIDSPVPVELKLSHRWAAKDLYERLENQLCGDYLRDIRSGRGIFLLVHQRNQERWTLPDNSKVDFAGLIRGLELHWMKISNRFPEIDDIKIIGIDLTKRSGGRRLARKALAGPQDGNSG